MKSLVGHGIHMRDTVTVSVPGRQLWKHTASKFMLIVALRN